MLACMVCMVVMLFGGIHRYAFRGVWSVSDDLKLLIPLTWWAACICVTHRVALPYCRTKNALLTIEDQAAELF